MPNYNQSTRQMIADIALGLRVDRDTGNITTGENLFTIAGGNVMLMFYLGEVTTVIQTKTVNFKLVSTPTVGTATDLCGNLDLSADEVGSLYTISGAAATAMQTGQSGSVIGQLYGVVVAPGTIDATVGATHTGSIKMSVWYLPLEDGAYMEAA